MRNILPLTLALALAPGCEGESGAPLRGSPPPNAVEVERIEPLPFSDTLELVGQLAAEESVVIRPELSGVIDEIHFSEGNTVPEGEVLFTLRSEEQRATLREARANLVLARNVHGRTQKLSDSQVAADSELERTHAEVAAAEAAVERAAVELARTRIQAPFDGALGARHVSPGDRVEAGDAMVQIDALERLQLQPTRTSASRVRSTSSRPRSIPRPGASSSRRGSPTATAACAPGSSPRSGSRSNARSGRSRFRRAPSCTTQAGSSSGG
jgi:multidrug efflux pump subunit AcrA (membrane-fusion protein)